jgi:hypothetical protein
VRAQSSVEWFTFSMRVNGVEFHHASWRSRGEHLTDFEVVIRDRQLGSFALHEEFVLELRSGKQGNAGWRPVTLLEIKDAVRKDAQMTTPDFIARTNPNSSPSHEVPRSSHRRIERIPVDGDSSHRDRLHTSLRHSRIQYQIVGGLDSRGRSAGHLTVAVSSLPGAGTCLRRAGFLESPESKFVLVDSITGWKVRLLKRGPQSTS